MTITCPDCGLKFTGPTEAAAIVQYEDHLPCQHWLSTYKIVRFFADDRPSEIVVRGLTLAQAQAHCSRDDSKGDGWFDGYTRETEES